MHELILMRHAEAEPPGPGDSDPQRPLTAFGLAQARRAGHWLLDQGSRPQVLAHSPALRTHQSAEQVHALLPGARLHAEPGMYLASAGELLVLAQAHAGCDALLLVGHNPGMLHLLQVLLGDAPERRQAMPPGTMARLRVAAALAPGCARLLAIHHP